MGLKQTLERFSSWMVKPSGACVCGANIGLFSTKVKLDLTLSHR
jgi:hypothetical protein